MRKFLLISIFLFIGYLSFSQSISGIIHNADGEPLIGAHIHCNSLNSYAVTKEDGSFSIKITVNYSAKLMISYVGFRTKTLNYYTTDNSDIGIIIMEEIQFATEEVNIIAHRSQTNVMDVAADISVVSAKSMTIIPSYKIDENMKYLPGVFINRPFGIFGKSVVGLRAVVSSEPGRQLTLVDGVPINKSDGGGTNWNRIIESDFERIEVLKGPGAALYGNNAMGGVINLVHKRPRNKGITGKAAVSFATYNTMNADLSLQHKLSDKEQSFYYTIAAKVIKSDGYITVPDSIREKTDTNVFIEEYGANARIGYTLSKSAFIEAEYNYYDEKRGQGSKIILEDGAVALYETHFSKLAFHNDNNMLKYDVNAFYQVENYGRDIEKIKRGNYSYIKVKSKREDYGATAMFRYALKNHNLSFGADYRSGSVYGVDEYQTATDKIINQGKIDVVNIYAQDNWQITNKITALLGLHFAYSKFYDGAFTLEDATSESDFMKDYAGNLDSKTWNGFSPRVSLKYDFLENMNVYALYSHGYRTPSLDDLTRFGFMSIGFKNANPNLSPEQIDNIEIGYRIQRSKWAFQTNINYAKGNNYMYYVATGKKLFGRKLIYNKENVTSVQLYGAEFNIEYSIHKNIKINLNYTYNNSKILEFVERPELELRKLTYVPTDLANLRFIYMRKKLSASINIHYQGEIYLDEINSFKVDPLFSLDASFNYNFYKGFGVNIMLQNILDEHYMVSSDQMSLGRFISAGLNYRF